MGDTRLMLSTSRAPTDFLGVRQENQSRRLSEPTKREAHHTPEALQELTDQFREATEDQSENCIQVPKVR